MDSIEICVFPNKSPFFNEANYTTWSIRMEAHMKAMRCDIWSSVVYGYIVPKIPTKPIAKTELRKKTIVAIASIFSVLLDFVKVKVGNFNSTKYIWDKIQELYIKEI